MDDFRNKNKPREHDWLHVSFLLTNVIIYVVMVIITNLAFQSIFPSNVPDPSTVYPIDIQPADWVFSIVWTIIFIWNVISLNKINHFYLRIFLILFTTSNSLFGWFMHLLAYSDGRATVASCIENMTFFIFQFL